MKGGDHVKEVVMLEERTKKKRVITTLCARKRRKEKKGSMRMPRAELSLLINFFPTSTGNLISTKECIRRFQEENCAR